MNKQIALHDLGLKDYKVMELKSYKVIELKGYKIIKILGLGTILRHNGL